VVQNAAEAAIIFEKCAPDVVVLNNMDCGLLGTGIWSSVEAVRQLKLVSPATKLEPGKVCRCFFDKGPCGSFALTLI
jgi:hypothetical protein